MQVTANHVSAAHITCFPVWKEKTSGGISWRQCTYRLPGVCGSATKFTGFHLLPCPTMILAYLRLSFFFSSKKKEDKKTTILPGQALFKRLRQLTTTAIGSFNCCKHQIYEIKGYYQEELLQYRKQSLSHAFFCWLTPYSSQASSDRQARKHLLLMLLNSHKK